MEKTCTKCKIKKTHEDFYRDVAHSGRLQSLCKKCSHENKKKWTKRNPEKVREYSKNYYHKDTEAAKKKVKDWQKANPHKIREYNKKWKDNNRDLVSQYKIDWVKKNPEKVKNSKKKWRHNNPEYGKNWDKMRRNSDSSYKLIKNIRTRLHLALKNNSKKSSTLSYLCCTIEQFKQHLESQFKEGMSWDNYGNKSENWSIDHIIPCAVFDHSDEEQIKKCWHYTNMQPMWHIENMRKGKKHDGPK